MHMIDVHASEGTFLHKHRFAQGACGPTCRNIGNEPRDSALTTEPIAG